MSEESIAHRFARDALADHPFLADLGPEVIDLLEAMAQRKLVVASDVGGHRVPPTVSALPAVAPAAAAAAGPMKRSWRDSFRRGWRPTRCTVSGSASFANRSRIVAR